MDRRRQIRMDEAELWAFLAGQRTVVCATLGPGGRPHLAALWFVPVGRRLDCWTYAASQKARNLVRDPRATLLTETGAGYQELRGASLECDAELVRDPELVLDIGVALAVRYGRAEAGPELRAGLSAQAAKRVGIRFTPTRVSSWDHRKLADG
jgi:PPOX class probable F420-dependent enzyme